MDFQGSVRLPVPREQAWKSLRDVGTFCRCVPGIKRVERHDATSARLVVEQQVSFLRAQFDLDQRIVSAEQYCLHTSATGKAPALGSTVQLDARLELEEDAGGTVLQYQVKLTVFGRLAAVGYMAMQAKAKEMEQELAANLQAELVRSAER